MEIMCIYVNVPFETIKTFFHNFDINIMVIFTFIVNSSVIYLPIVPQQFT